MKRSRSGIKQACGPSPGLLVKDLPRVGPKTLHWNDGNDVDGAVGSAGFASGVTGDICAVPHGDDYQSRTGPRIHAKRVELTAQYVLPSTSSLFAGFDAAYQSNTELVWFIVLDKCHTGASPASVETVFDHGSSGKMRRDMAARDRFKILASGAVTLNTENVTDGSYFYQYGKTKTVDVTLDMDIPIDYNPGTATGTMGVLKKNSINFYTFPRTQANNGSAVAYSCELHGRLFFTT